MKSGIIIKKNRKVDDSVCAYGWRQLTYHIASFIAQIDDAKSVADIEPIHQLRVFSRRISTTLRLFEACFPGNAAVTWRKDIRKTAGSFGEVRDLDVQIAFVQKYIGEQKEKNLRSGIKRLELRLTQRRLKLQKKTVRRIETLEKSGILFEIQTFLSKALPQHIDEPVLSSSLYRLARQSIERELSNMMTYQEIVLQPDKVDELHKMRIAAKSLRYTIEVFAPIYPDKLKPAFQAIRLTQELLGSIHDLDVWKLSIPAFIQAESNRTEKYFGSIEPFSRLLPGMQQFAKDVSLKRDQTYDEFTQIWLKWKEDELWSSLIKSLETV